MGIIRQPSCLILLVLLILAASICNIINHKMLMVGDDKGPLFHVEDDVSSKCNIAISTTTTTGHRPKNPKTANNYTVGLCAILKDHEAYLMEWIDYHLIGLEFDNIYLYDNSDEFELHQWYNESRGHPIYSRVEVMHRPGQYLTDKEMYVQRWVYTDCVKRFGQGKQGEDYDEFWENSPKHEYMAIFDTDEFITFPQRLHSDIHRQHPLSVPSSSLSNGMNNHTITTPVTSLRTIHDLLDIYLVPYGGALAINWMYYGTSNHTLFAPIPVTKRFQYRDAAPMPHVKTIVKSNDYKSQRSPHRVNLKNGANYHDTTSPGGIASKDRIPDHVVVMNHYRFMSLKEYQFKRCNRGETDGAYRGCRKGKIANEDLDEHMRVRPGHVFDDSAWQFLRATVPKYQAFDGPEWNDFT